MSTSIPTNVSTEQTNVFWPLTAVVAIAAIVPALLMMGPAVAGQLSVQLNMTPSAIGLLFMSELGAMSIATLPALYWLRRWNLQKAAMAFGAVFIVANILSVWANDGSTLTMLRVLSGLAGGSLTVICVSSTGTFDKPDRAYGFWVLGQLVLGACGLSLLPRLFSLYGLEVFFLILAVLMLLCLPIMRFLPDRIINEHAVHKPHKTNTFPVKPVLGLTAIFLFYLSLNGTWTFIGTLASEAGINAQSSGDVLAIATLFGIAGALIATLMGGRKAYKIPLVSGYLIMIISMVALIGISNAVHFSMAAFAFKFAWTFVLPFILASLARHDTNGQLMNLTNLVIGGGLAIGPMLAGQIIDIFSNVEPFLYIAIVMTACSLLLISTLQSKHN